jgi:hypothetical protein
VACGTAGIRWPTGGLFTKLDYASNRRVIVFDFRYFTSGQALRLFPGSGGHVVLGESSTGHGSSQPSRQQTTHNLVDGNTIISG